MPTVIVSVISDLVTDQRVHKVAQTLHEMGFTVLLTGTKKRNSLPISTRDYLTKRIKIFFEKGFLFYAEWNVRLFFFLLSKPAKILLANDLDTLPPNFFISKIKKNILVYDTHEYFTETAELYNRKFVKSIWQKIENFFFPKVKYIYTVNKSIAELYNKKYNKNIHVVRNVPLLKKYANAAEKQLKLPTDKKILLTQGSGLNKNRGLEELVEALSLLPEEFILVIAGNGLIIEQLKSMAVKNNVNDRVIFTGILQPQELQQLTPLAFCGFSLDKPLNLNQQASLPNKLFDYIAAGIPVITTNIKEVAAIVEQFNIGIVINECNPVTIATVVKTMAKNEPQYAEYKKNTTKAYEQLNWNIEKKIVENIFTNLALENNITIE